MAEGHRKKTDVGTGPGEGSRLQPRRMSRVKSGGAASDVMKAAVISPQAGPATYGIADRLGHVLAWAGTVEPRRRAGPVG